MHGGRADKAVSRSPACPPQSSSGNNCSILESQSPSLPALYRRSGGAEAQSILTSVAAATEGPGVRGLFGDQRNGYFLTSPKAVHMPFCLSQPSAARPET
jgi:hypothetical protein